MKPRQQPMKRTELKRAPFRLNRERMNESTGHAATPAKRGPVKPRQQPVTSAEREARRLVRERSGGTCEGACGNTPASDWHHRKNRTQGGRWAADDGMDLCRSCHAYVTDHPQWGYARGWSVRSTLDPAAIPCLRRGSYVWLLPDGSFEECEMTEIRAWLGGAA